MLSSMIAMGICMGMQPAISFNYAAGDRTRTRRIVRNTGLIAFAAAIVLSLACYFFRVPILTAFIDNDEVRTVGEIVLTASVLGCPFFALYQLCATWLQSTGTAGFLLRPGFGQNSFLNSHEPGKHRFGGFLQIPGSLNDHIPPRHEDMPVHRRLKLHPGSEPAVPADK